MVQNLFAVFSLLIGAAGLLLTYAGHRQKVRQDAQESALRAEEQRRIERDREQERQQAHARREQEARARRNREARDRERDRYQASMVSGYLGLSPSSLDDGWVVPQIVIYNGSNQPVRNVRASFRGEMTDEQGLVGTGHHFFPLAPKPVPGKSYEELGEVIVEFTDVAGVRWRREGSGVLRRARQGGDRQTTWGEPEQPVVERADEFAGATAPTMHAPAPAELPRGARPSMHVPGAPPPASRRAGCFGWLVVLVSVALIAGGIWWLVH
jgi:hypothetical protein